MRTRLASLVLLVAVFFGAIPAPSADAQTAAAASTSSLIVKVVSGLTPDAQTAIVGRNGGTVTSSIPALRLLVVSVPEADLAGTLARYQADPQVQSAEQNKVRQSESIPSDALYGNQWALPKIGWDQVFGVVTPAGSAKVALLDTGVDASHAELAGKVVAGTSILDGSNGMTDPSGHGTWLAGIIAAQTNNGLEGIAGVAYSGVQVMPVTVLNSNGEGMDSDVIAGVIWAADHGADVILMAFSNPGFSPNLQDAIDYAWSRGAVIVASAGNNASSEPHFPAGDRGVMGVAATDQGDGQAFFSNEGQSVFIAAPGVDIQTIHPGGAYTAITGTSAAAAHVAGVAAFIKAVQPALPNGVIVFRIASTADPAGTQLETGNGRINMARAVVSTATDSIQPAGAAPVGSGGPFVGPYHADARQFTITFAGGGTGTLTINLGSGVDNIIQDLGSGANACSGTISNGNKTATINDPRPAKTSCIPSLKDNNASGTLTAAANASSQFGGWSGSNNLSPSTCNGLTNPCTFTVNGSQPAITATFNVANTAPTIAFTASPTPVDESGTTQRTYTFSITDPDVGDSWTFVTGYPMCGSGGNLVTGSPLIDTPTKTGSFKCVFPDGLATSIVAVKVRDSANAQSNEATRAVTVNNVAPTATLGSAGSVNEGSSVTISFSGQSDPSGADTTAGFHYVFSCTDSDLSAATYATGGTNPSVTCTFDDGPAIKTVRARIIDKDNGFTEYTTSVTVNNVAPTASLSNNGPVDEGGSATISFGGPIDPSSADTTAGFHYAFACDNGDLSGATYATGSAASSTTCAFNDGPATKTVRARIIDKDNGFTEYTTSVTVNNVAPTASLGNNGPVNEGSVATISFSNQFDPSSDDTAAGFHYAFACDNGSLSGATYAGSSASASTSCTFDDGPATKTVRARIIDKDGGFTEYTTSVYVKNVAPTASLGNNGPINEGSSATISFSSPFDPSAADTAAGFRYAFSCDNGDLSSAIYAASGTNTSTTCSFDDGPAAKVIKGRIIDKDGGFTEYTTTVSVRNVAPTATLGNNGPVNEGSVATITFTGPFDPSAADTVAGFHYAFSCANGDLNGATYASSSTTAYTMCTFRDGPSTQTVKGRIIDKDGGYTEYTTAVTVNNVPPAITQIIGPILPVPVNTAITVTANFTDPGADDTHTCSFLWDDGTSTPPTQPPLGASVVSCSASHTYSQAGVYTVGITVKDKDDGTATGEHRYVVVYDPSAGFVTGGGWIMSLPGAYIPNPSLSGKANFGFVSKYKKGATVPTGETEFQFHAGAMNFHSTEYQYLVIAGVKAQYKGVGTINGSGNYGFLLTATDGDLKTGDGVDKFRIKIWDRVSGNLVYDNAQPPPGVDPDTEDLDLIQPQAIGGGSIVIHSGK